MKYILGICVFFFVAVSFNLLSAGEIKTPKHKIVVQYKADKPEFLRAWLDSTVIISDTLYPAKKMPPVVRMIGIGNLYDYNKLTLIIGRRPYATRIPKDVIDIVINPADTAKPVVFYKHSILLK